ncbi:MAG TPA: 50S ribosomal protein L25 [Actinomycetota bacterium]|nr:50S ribosomal protein L25 [Actinomycetota bacterium]
MAEVALKAEVRQERGKGPARRLRAAGKVPATVYGRGMDAVAVTVDARELDHTLSTDAGANVLIDLKVGSDTHLTLARALDRHPIRGTILHVDFLKIARDVAITVDVPVHFDGEAKGVKEGGVLEHHLWQLHVECLPGNVPERINIDVSAMDIGSIIRVSDVRVPDGVTVLNGEEEIIVTCVVPQILKVEEEVPAEEAVAAEGEEGEAAEAAEGAEAGEAGGGSEES